MTKPSQVKGMAAILKGLENQPARGPLDPEPTVKWLNTQPEQTEVAQFIEESRKVAQSSFEEARKGPGRPPGKRSDPNFDRMTVLVRKETLDDVDMMLLKEKNGPKDRSELVEILLRNHLQGYAAAKPD